MADRNGGTSGVAIVAIVVLVIIVIVGLIYFFGKDRAGSPVIQNPSTNVLTPNAPSVPNQSPNSNR